MYAVIIVENAKVLILGAGMAGISAAKRLKDLGIDDFLIIEGSDKIGGRVQQQQLGDYTVQTGCLWFYGVNDNPIHDMMVANNISFRQNDYEDYKVINKNGKDLTAVADRAYEEILDDALGALRTMSSVSFLSLEWSYITVF